MRKFSTPPKKLIKNFSNPYQQLIDSQQTCCAKPAARPDGAQTPRMRPDGAQNPLCGRCAGRPEDAGLAVTPYTAGVRGFTTAPAKGLRQEADLPPHPDGALTPRTRVSRGRRRISADTGTG